MSFRSYWELHLVLALAALDFERARVARWMVAWADRQEAACDESH